MTSPSVSLTLSADAYDAMIRHALDCYPEEMCGLLAAAADGSAPAFYPCRNTTRSGRVFEIHPMDYLRAEDDAEARGLRLAAVVHSHTHTEPYPSPTDVGVAGNLGPELTWVIVGLKRHAAETRHYRIADGVIAEAGLSVAG
ncbi:MAG: M67 family metallopeptidase [Ilumatobacteraceae bacterium]